MHDDEMNITAVLNRGHRILPNSAAHITEYYIFIGGYDSEQDSMLLCLLQQTPYNKQAL